MEKFSVIIIGGGASGIDLATLFVQSGFKDFCIVEKSDRIGKKLIATGNGQGNLTNKNVSDKKYFSGVKDFCSYAVNRFGFNKIVSFYSLTGIILTEGEEGRFYPESKQASSVLDVIRAFLIYNAVNIKTGFEVNSVKKKNGLFEVTSSSGEKLYADRVVFAFGGSSGRQFGTDGSAYKLAVSQGHRCTETYPSLVQLKTETDKIRSLKGLKADVKITAFSDGKFVGRADGEILFTDYGVSGNSVFKISAYTAGKLGVELNIEFLPEITEKELEKIIALRLEKMPYIEKKDVFIGLVNKMIGRALVGTARSDDAKDLSKAAKNFRLKVTGDLGFNYSQVTRGGICLKDVDEKTYESKITRGVYIIGEALDVDGECGGYNLHFAFASAACAAEAITGKELDFLR